MTVQEFHSARHGFGAAEEKLVAVRQISHLETVPGQVVDQIGGVFDQWDPWTPLESEHP